MSATNKKTKNIRYSVLEDRVPDRDGYLKEALKYANDEAGNQVSLEDVRLEVERKIGIDFKEISDREDKTSVAHALYCYLAKEKAGVSGAQLMRELKISSDGVARLVARGERLYADAW